MDENTTETEFSQNFFYHIMRDLQEKADTFIRLHENTLTRPDAVNLVYFASDSDTDRIEWYYQTEQFRRFHIFLVSASHRDNYILHNRIVCLRTDVAHAVELFKKYRIKFDYFTAINEGLYEGGARYPLNKDTFQGFVMPVLKNEYYHYLDHSYKISLPHSSVSIIPPDSPEYAAVHSDYLPGILYKVKLHQREPVSFRINHLTINLLNKSIWDDARSLDIMYARLNRGMWEMVAPFYPNLKDFQRRIDWNEDPTRRFDQIIRDVNREHARKIGFIPFGYSNNYPRFIDFLSDADTGPLEEINLYHLNINDFGDLYKDAVGYNQIPE